MDGEGDAEAGALALNDGKFFASVSRRHPVTALLALVVAGLGIESASLGQEITPVHVQSGAWCCRTSRPKLVALLAAFGSRNAENSNAKPAGSPFL